jgi:hypothetical protein
MWRRKDEPYLTLPIILPQVEDKNFLLKTDSDLIDFQENQNWQ